MNQDNESTATFLTDGVVSLRKLLSADCLNSYLRFINDVDHLSWTDVGVLPFNRDDLVVYINSTEGLLLGIFSDMSAHIGNIRLSRIDSRNRQAELGLVIAREHGRKGYASRAVKLVTRHAFDVMNLHRVYLCVVEANLGAVELYRRLGFVEEGIERQSFYFQQTYHNVIRMSLLSEEFVRVNNHWSEDAGA